MKAKLVLSIVWLLVGIAIGIGIATMSFAPRASYVSPPVVTRATLPKLQQQPPPPVRAQATQMSKPPFRDRLMALSEMNSLLRAKIRVPLLVGEDINEDFVKLYGMSAHEVAQLKASFSAAKHKIAELDAAHALIEPMGVHAYSISIPAYPQEGGVVYDELMRSIREVLGDERFAAYLSTGNELLDTSAFGKFGMSETVIAIRPAEVGEAPGSTSGSISGFGGDRPMQVVVDTDTSAFPTLYPEIYRKMLAAGLWK